MSNQQVNLKAIADAIRAKDGTTDAIPANTFAERIAALSGGGSHDVEDGIITRGLSGEYQNDRVEAVGEYAFYGCKSISALSFPLVTSIGDYAFYRCSSLTTADFPQATSIGDYAFYRCSALTTADFPLITSVRTSAFYQCSALTTADFPQATSIENYAFNGCSVLTSADFPLITSVGSGAFYQCSALAAFILRNVGGICTLSSQNAFGGTPIDSGTGYIYVPSALLEDYKAATNWSTYADQFRALEDYTVDGTTTGALDESKI